MEHFCIGPFLLHFSYPIDFIYHSLKKIIFWKNLMNIPRCNDITKENIFKKRYIFHLWRHQLIFFIEFFQKINYWTNNVWNHEMYRTCKMLQKKLCAKILHLRNFKDIQIFKTFIIFTPFFFSFFFICSLFNYFLSFLSSFQLSWI